jgi:quinol monooxygenase YgiN
MNSTILNEVGCETVDDGLACPRNFNPAKILGPKAPILWDTMAVLKRRNSLIDIMWIMQAAPDRIKEFHDAYNPGGLWVQLFRRAEGYISTDLRPDLETENRFLVIDRWHDLATFHSFKKEHQAAYDKLDRQCEALTLKETKIGIFLSQG